MKKLIYSTFSLLLLFSCNKKDKFECGVENQMAPADDSGRIFVPTAFSPNGDGLNDVFKPYYINIKSTDFRVYDTDNKLVFQTTDLAAGWTDDTDIKGVKLYHFRLDAITNKGNQISKCGDLFSYRCLPDNFDCRIFIFGDQFDPADPEGYLHGPSQENFELCNP